MYCTFSLPLFGTYLMWNKILKVRYSLPTPTNFLPNGERKEKGMYKRYILWSIILLGERKGGAFNHFMETSTEDEEDLNHLLKSMHKVNKTNGFISYI